MNRTLPFLLAALLATPAFAALTTPEAKIAAAVDADQERKRRPPPEAGRSE